MARKVQCKGPRCQLTKATYDKDTMTAVKGEYFCSSCYQDKATEEEDLKQLYNYLCKIFNIDFISGHLKADIKRLTTEGYTLKDIRFTLHYVVVVLSQTYPSFKNPDVKYGILTIVRQNCEAMKAYRAEKNAKKEQVAAIAPEKLKITIRTITVKPPERKFDYKSSKMINLEELANAINKQ